MTKIILDNLIMMRKNDYKHMKTFPPRSHKLIACGILVNTIYYIVWQNIIYLRALTACDCSIQ